MKKFSFTLLTVMTLMIPVQLRAETKKEASLSMSYVATSGNARTQTLGLDAIGKFEKNANRLLLNAGTVYGENRGTNTAKYWYARAKDEYTVSEKTYALGKLDVEGNKLAGYDLRITFNTGIGHRFIETDKHELSGEMGPGVVHEKRSNEKDLTYTSGRAYTKYAYKINDTANFSQDIEYLHDIENDNNYRINAETALTFKIAENISFKTGLSIKYVNTPPSGNENTDVYSSTAIVMTF